MPSTPPRQLALAFQPSRLTGEAEQFAPDLWQDSTHPAGQVLRLVAVGGNADNPDGRGPMQPTPHLQRCPATRALLARLRTPLGRVLLWRPPAGASETSPAGGECRDHVRLHAVIAGESRLQVAPGADPVVLTAGQVWLLPPASLTGEAIHLVIETVGSSHLWRLATGHAPVPAPEAGPSAEAPLAFERVNYPVVMTPWELEHHLARVAYGLDEDTGAAARDALLSVGETLVQDWRAVWACLGDSEEAIPAYRGLLSAFAAGLDALAGRTRLADGRDPAAVLHACVVTAALNPELRPPAAPRLPPRQPAPPTAARRKPQATRTSRFDRPVFIVAAPRSGSSLVFETLADSPTVWTVGGESHAEFEGIPALHPINRAWDSNRLDASAATPEVERLLHAAFLKRLKDRAGKRLAQDGSTFRLLEKTPKNAVRVAFLASLFPDARFIYLYREPRGNISSIIEAWRSGRFVTYPQLPGWTGAPWSLVLIPGWRALNGAPLERIAAAQWRAVNETVLADLGRLPDDRWRAISYEEFIADPEDCARRLARFAEIGWNRRLDGELPLSRHTLTPPRPDKWRANEALIETVLDQVIDIDRACREALASHRP